MKGFRAINLFGIIFARKEYYPLSERTKAHEAIHTNQIKELAFIFFYLWYGFEWLIRLAQYRNAKDAYYNISFEREAYTNESDGEYLNKRGFFAFLKYME